MLSTFSHGIEHINKVLYPIAARVQESYLLQVLIWTENYSIIYKRQVKEAHHEKIHRLGIVEQLLA